MVLRTPSCCTLVVAGAKPWRSIWWDHSAWWTRGATLVAMSFPSDLEIARGGKLAPLTEIAAMMGIGPHLLEQHGDELAKIRLEAIDFGEYRSREVGSLVPLGLFGSP